MTSPLASTMSTGVRTALLALLGLLVVIFGCLIAFAFVLRRRPDAAVGQPTSGSEQERQETQQSAHTAGQPMRLSVLRDPMACPVCRRELGSDMRYCPYDATRLLPAPDMLARVGERPEDRSICPRCRRAFESRHRFCPHDGADLISLAAYKSKHAPALEHHHTNAPGEIAKICPECQGRYGYAASFCGKDGVELVVLN